MHSTAATTIDELQCALKSIINENQDFEFEDLEEDEASKRASASARLDLADAILALITHLEKTSAHPSGLQLEFLENKLITFQSSDGKNSSLGAAVVRLMTVHKAKGQGFHRVYLLQPHNIPMPTKMQYGEQWERQDEINVAFVALTRSYADLIFLRHIQRWEVDLTQLWPDADEREQHEHRSGSGMPASEQERRLTAALGVLKVELPPCQDRDAVIGGSSEARSGVRAAAQKAYFALAKKMHPDKAPKDETSQREAARSFQEVNGAHQTIVEWLEKLGLPRVT